MNMIEFSYMTWGPNAIHTDINNNNVCMAAVYVNTETVLALMDDMLTEWDMLTDDQREYLKEISGQIAAMVVE